MNDLSERPLDHTTARVVTELAATLLPHIRETLAAEFSRAISLLSQSPPGLERNAEAVPGSLERMLDYFKEEVEGLEDRITNSLAKHLSSAPPQQGMEEQYNRMEASLERLIQIAERSHESIVVERSEEDKLVIAEIKKFTNIFDEMKSDWEGILKANGRAHTRELSEFSAEVTELLKEMRSSLPQMIADAVEKEVASRDAEWLQALRENGKATEGRLARFEKSIVISGAVAAAFLAIVALVLYL